MAFDFLRNLLNPLAARTYGSTPSPTPSPDQEIEGDTPPPPALAPGPLGSALGALGSPQQPQERAPSAFSPRAPTRGGTADSSNSGFVTPLNADSPIPTFEAPQEQQPILRPVAISIASVRVAPSESAQEPEIAEFTPADAPQIQQANIVPSSRGSWASNLLRLAFGMFALPRSAGAFTAREGNDSLALTALPENLHNLTSSLPGLSYDATAGNSLALTTGLMPGLTHDGVPYNFSPTGQISDARFPAIPVCSSAAYPFYSSDGQLFGAFNPQLHFRMGPNNIPQILLAVDVCRIPLLNTQSVIDSEQSLPSSFSALLDTAPHAAQPIVVEPEDDSNVLQAFDVSGDEDLETQPSPSALGSPAADGEGSIETEHPPAPILPEVLIPDSANGTLATGNLNAPPLVTEPISYDTAPPVAETVVVEQQATPSQIPAPSPIPARASASPDLHAEQSIEDTQPTVQEPDAQELRDLIFGHEGPNLIGRTRVEHSGINISRAGFANRDISPDTAATLQQPRRGLRGTYPPLENREIEQPQGTPSFPSARDPLAHVEDDVINFEDLLPPPHVGPEPIRDERRFEALPDREAEQGPTLLQSAFNNSGFIVGVAAFLAGNFMSNNFVTWLGGRRDPAQPLATAPQMAAVGVAPLMPAAGGATQTWFALLSNGVYIAGQLVALAANALEHPERVAALRQAALGPDVAPVPGALPAAPQPSLLNELAGAMQRSPGTLDALTRALPGAVQAFTTPGGTQVLTDNIRSVLDATSGTRAAPETSTAGSPPPPMTSLVDTALEAVRRNPAAVDAALGLVAPLAAALTTPGGAEPIAANIRSVIDATSGTRAAPPAPLAPGATHAPTESTEPSILTSVAGALSRNPGAVDAALGLVAPLAAALTSPDPAAAAALATRARENLNAFVGALSGGDPAAESWGAWAMNAATDQGKKLLLSGLSLVLAKAASAPAIDPAVRAQLQKMIAEIDRIKAGSGNLDELRTSLTRIMDGTDADTAAIRNILNVHFNGLESFLRTEEPTEARAEAIIRENLAALPPGPAPTERDFKAGSAIAQAKIAKNITASSVMQIINQYLCKGKIDETRISEIFGVRSEDSTRDVPRDDKYLENVRNGFFTEIDKLDFSWPYKTFVKVSYRFMSWISHRCLDKFLTGLREEIETATKPTSEAQSQAQTQALHTAIVRRTNSYLNILRGSIERVNKNPSPTGTPVEMIEKELAKPEFNHNYTKEQLYSTAISKAIQEIYPTLGWAENFNEKVGKLPGWAQWTLTPLTWPTWAIVRISEAIGNVITQSVLKGVITHYGVLELVINLSVGQIRNGYTHSINKVIYDLLKNVWEELKKDPSARTGPKTTVANKEELRDLVTNLYKVLELNKRAGNANPEPTILEKAESAIYGSTVNYSADVIALLIDEVKNTLLDPKGIPEKTCTILEALNHALESKDTASPEDMAKLENDIAELSNAILNRATKTVVHNYFTGEQSQIAGRFQEFKEQLTNEAVPFINHIKEHIRTPNRDALLQEMQRYNRALSDLQQLVDANNELSTSEKGIFNTEYTTPIAQLLTRLGEAIRANQPAEAQTALVGELERLLGALPEVGRANGTAAAAASILPMGLLEGAANKVAFQGAKGFFDAAVKAIRTSYNWRYGAVHHGVMLPFIESKK